MKKINTFFHVFKNSLFPLEPYYNKIPKTSFKFSLKYFFSLIFILNTFMFIILFVRYSPIVTHGKELYISTTNALKTYPSDLIIRVTKGQLTTNRDQPYFMWLKRDSISQPLIVVDKQALATDINRYNSLILIASNGIGVTLDGFPQYYYFTHDETFRVEKLDVEVFRGTLDTIYSRLPFYIVMIGIFALFLFPVIAIIINAFMLAVISVAVYIIANRFLQHKHVTYKKVFQISLHSSTLPFFIDFLFLGLGIPMGIPFGSVLLYILFLTAGMYEVYALHRTFTSKSKTVS